MYDHLPCNTNVGGCGLDAMLTVSAKEVMLEFWTLILP